ncbi:GH3 auxin-responsive promoter family protein [Acidobacteriota bacterium]
MKDPFPVQEKTLLDLLQNAAGTRWGKKYGYDRIRSIHEYQERVPIGEYLDFKDDWDRYFKGEKDVTWPGHTKYFPITSGTTAGNKLIPLTEEGIASNLKAGKDTLFFYVQQTENWSLFTGKILYLGGSTDLVKGEGGTYIGDLSGMMNLFVPWYAKPFRTPPCKISLMKNWEEKLERIVSLTMKQDIRAMTGIPSWLIIFTERVYERFKQKTGRMPENLKEVWPNLKLLIPGGIRFDPYKHMFEGFFGEGAHFLEVYPASEGFIAMQNELGRPDLLLMLDYGIFYEFIPADKLGQDSPPHYTVADVETGVNYAIILTTNSGLWRYILGDTVRFTSLNPHKLVITGRTKHFLSAFGEHLIVEEVEEAVSRAAANMGLDVSDFHVAPLFPTSEKYKPRHEWILELTKPVEGLDRAKLAFELDAVVQDKNDDYSAHRQGDTGLDLPLITLVPQGTFYETMKRLGKLGGQHKVPRLHNDRSFADELLAEKESHS